MRKLAYVTIILSAAALLGGITQDEATVSGALQALKFESAPGDPKRIGAEPEFKVTKETLKYLQKLQKDNKTIYVKGDGSVYVK